MGSLYVNSRSGLFKQHSASSSPSPPVLDAGICPAATRDTWERDPAGHAVLCARRGARRTQAADAGPRPPRCRCPDTSSARGRPPRRPAHWLRTTRARSPVTCLDVKQFVTNSPLLPAQTLCIEHAATGSRGPFPAARSVARRARRRRQPVQPAVRAGRGRAVGVSRAAASVALFSLPRRAASGRRRGAGGGRRGRGRDCERGGGR